MVKVKVKKLHKDAKLPTYAHLKDSGADVYCVEDIILDSGQTKLIKLGFAVEIPDGWEIQVRSRSGLSKNGIVVANSPGTVDAPYRGPMGVILHNQGGEDLFIEKGTRIAQFVLKRAPQAIFEWTEELSESDRGSGGFGSTGLK